MYIELMNGWMGGLEGPECENSNIAFAMAMVASLLEYDCNQLSLFLIFLNL